MRHSEVLTLPSCHSNAKHRVRAQIFVVIEVFNLHQSAVDGSFGRMLHSLWVSMVFKTLSKALGNTVVSELSNQN